MKIEKYKKGENNMTPTYIGDIDLNEETLAHFGVKGMKWGKRKAKLKADLKWKVGKLKGKALEAKAKYKRNKYHYILNNDNVTKNARGLNNKTKLGSIESDWMKYDRYGDNPRAEGSLKNSPPGWNGKRTYENAGDLKRGTSAGRSRKATESYVKSMGKVTGSTRSSSVSVSKPKSSKKQSSYGGGEKWQPRTNAEKTAKRNDDFINSKGGQELLKVYKRKKAMSSRKSTKA